MASKVTVEFTVDDHGAVTGIKNVGDAAEKAGQQAEAASPKMSGHSSALGSIGTVASGIVAAGAVEKLGGFLTSAAQAAADDEAATVRLSTALQNAGGDFDAHLAKANDAIDAGAKLAFSDDDIRDSLVTLTDATGDSDEALKRLAVAQDLARGANIPLTEASKLLGKVTDDNTQVLKRMGITLPDVANSADVLAAVQGKFAGQSENYAKSTAGQFQKAQIQMAELKESIGYALIPVVTTLASVFNDKVTPAFAIIGNHINIIGPAILAGLVPAFIAWAISATAAAIPTIVAAAPLIALSVAIAALVAGIIILVTNWDTITAKVPALGVATDAVQVTISALTDWITGTFIPVVMTIYDTVSTVVGDVVTFVQDHWHEVYDAIAPALDLLKGYFDMIWGDIQVIVSSALTIITGVFDVFKGLFTGDWDLMWSGIKEIVDGVWEGIKGIVGNAITFITTDLVPSALAAATALGGALKDGIIAGFKGTVGALGDLTSQLWGAMKAIINSGIQAINDAIPDSIGFDVGAFGVSKHVSIDIINNPIPLLAAGGIVSKPTLAILGEAGPEAVVPLSQLSVTTAGAHPLGETHPGGSAALAASATAANDPTLKVLNQIAAGQVKIEQLLAQSLAKPQNISGVIATDLRALASQLAKYMKYELDKIAKQQFSGTAATT